MSEGPEEGTMQFKVLQVSELLAQGRGPRL